MNEIQEDFQHNMRPTAFQCCQDAGGLVTGMRLTFSTMQNNPELPSIDYFVADSPKQLTTGCIGPFCNFENCSDFVEIKAFPEGEDPITGLIFHDVEGQLYDFKVQVGSEETSICRQVPPANTGTEIALEVNAPIIGFEFSYDLVQIRSIRLVSNPCSMHDHAAFDLDLGDVPEPIMIQL